MKYLDENIEITINGITVPAAGTYPYYVYQGNDEVVFFGNAFLNAGDTTKTFDITDILSNLKWKGSLVKPLSYSKTEKVNVINRYKVTLSISGFTYNSSFLDVALIYRYPNRKAALEADILDADDIDSPIFKNCLQGSKNGVCALLPHIPYKMTGQYAFGAVAEYASTNNFNDSIEYDYDFDGQLCTDSGITATWSGATTQNIRSLTGFYSSSQESYKYTHDISTTLVDWTTRSLSYSPTNVYRVNIRGLRESPTALNICTGSNGGTHLGRFPFSNGTVHVLIEAVPNSGKIFIMHNGDDTNHLSFYSSAWNNITYPVRIEFDAVKTNLAITVTNLRFSRGHAYQEETYLDVKTTKYLTTVVATGINRGVTVDECIEYLGRLGYTYAEAENILTLIGRYGEATIFTGTYQKASLVYRDADDYFTVNLNPNGAVYDDPQHVAIVDMGCLPKYYLLWQDRYGGYQSQPFEKTETFSIGYKYEEMKDYQNRRRNVNVKVQPSWKIQTGWIDEEFYPYYESIFSSPYVLLYDTEEDVSYNVMATDKKYTEKTWKNQHKFFNLQLNLEENKVQNIVY